jgi:hypothetical protein
MPCRIQDLGGPTCLKMYGNSSKIERQLRAPTCTAPRTLIKRSGGCPSVRKRPRGNSGGPGSLGMIWRTSGTVLGGGVRMRKPEAPPAGLGGEWILLQNANEYCGTARFILPQRATGIPQGRCVAVLHTGEIRSQSPGGTFHRSAKVFAKRPGTFRTPALSYCAGQMTGCARIERT